MSDLDVTNHRNSSKEKTEELRPPQYPKSVKMSDREGVYNLRVVGRLKGPPIVQVKKTNRLQRPKSAIRKSRPKIKTSAETLAFVKVVRYAFTHDPEVYEEFKALMLGLQNPQADVIALIRRVITLFNGYPELIYRFESFLPDEYELDVQEDAVVIKVYEECTPLSMMSSQKNESSDLSREYIQGVKKALTNNRPMAYRQFNVILEEYSSGKINDLKVIQKLVKVFRGYPNLVLGFNEFLPETCKIHMYDTRNYTVEYKNERGITETMVLSAI